MRTLLREVLLLAVSAALSWLVIFGWTPAAHAALPEPAAHPLAVVPELAAVLLDAPPAAAAPKPPAAGGATPAQQPRVQEHPAAVEHGPPPPERGTPEGREQDRAAELPPKVAAKTEAKAAERTEAKAAEKTRHTAEEPTALERSAPDQPAARPPQAAKTAEPVATLAAKSADPPEAAGDAQAPRALMHDGALLAAAQGELTDSTRKGFATVFLAVPEDQLDIARYFGEELVLLPRAAIDPKAADPHYFRVALAGRPEIERVVAAAPQDRRQYRDLFDYEYSRLPAVLRELRRTVLMPTEIYRFAALIPLSEWALVIARRRQALATAGRALGDVRRFTLRYRRLPAGGFDIDVTEVLFADGRRWCPTAGEQQR